MKIFDRSINRVFFVFFFGHSFQYPLILHLKLIKMFESHDIFSIIRYKKWFLWCTLLYIRIRNNIYITHERLTAASLLLNPITRIFPLCLSYRPIIVKSVMKMNSNRTAEPNFIIYNKKMNLPSAAITLMME